MPFLPFLLKAKGFLSSSKFLNLALIAILVIFLVSQAISFVTRYVELEVKQRVELSLSKQEVEGLKNQVKVLKRNQQIVTQVVKDTKVIQEKQAVKAQKIEDKIDEQVSNGEDNTGAIIAGVIDSL